PEKVPRRRAHRRRFEPPCDSTRSALIGQTAESSQAICQVLEGRKRSRRTVGDPPGGSAATKKVTVGQILRAPIALTWVPRLCNLRRPFRPGMHEKGRNRALSLE